jgi:putative ATPase
MRPAALDDVVGQAHLLGPGAPLRRLVEGGRLPSMLLWGPPGSGKTTIGRLLAEAVGARFEALNTTMDGVAALRDVVGAARNEAAFRGATTVVFLDEVHRYS